MGRFNDGTKTFALDQSRPTGAEFASAERAISASDFRPTAAQFVRPFGLKEASAVENLVIDAPFFAGGPSRRDEAAVPLFSSDTLAKDDDDFDAIDDANGPPAVFVFVVLCFSNDAVSEDRGDIFEIDSMLLPVCFCFFIVPLEAVELEEFCTPHIDNSTKLDRCSCDRGSQFKKCTYQH